MNYLVRLLIISAVAVCVLGVALLLLKLTFMIAIVAALVLAGAVALAMLSGKRMRSTPDTRPPPLP